MAVRIRVLFVCVGNSCRSQMAEAIAGHLAADVIEPSSAGLLPFGEIMELTIQVLTERRIALHGQYSKLLRPYDLAAADMVINIAGGTGAKMLQDPKGTVEDWYVPDPYGLNMVFYRKTRDDIEARVTDLARRLRAKQSQKSA